MDADAGGAPPLHEGDALTGRYRLVRRTGGSAPAQGPAPLGSTSSWHARDLVLRRPVELLAVAGGAEDVVDAARRAALVEDPRVLRVLDVGSTVPGPRPPGRPGDPADTATTAGSLEDVEEGARPGWSFVVTESVAGESLAALVGRRGPLPAALVRTLVGEAAQALERARSLGLHHRRLSPEHLLRAGDGGVVVTGLEVRAAAADGDPADPGAPGSRADGDGVLPDAGDQEQGAGAASGDHPGSTSGPRLAGPGEVDPAVAARADAVALVALLYAGLTGRRPDPLRGAHGADDDADRAHDGAGVGAGHGTRSGGLAPAARSEAGPVPPGDLVDDVPADLDVLCSVVLGPHEDGPRTPGELADQLAPWESPYLDGRPGGGGGAPVTAGAASVPAARRPGSAAPAGGTAAGVGAGVGGAGEDLAVEEPPVRDHEPEDERVPVGALTGTGAADRRSRDERATTVPATTAAASAVPPSVPVPGRPALRPRPRAAGAAAAGAAAPGGRAAGATGGSTGGGTRGGVLAAEPAGRPSRAQTAVVIAVALVAVVVALVLALGVLQGIGAGGGDDGDGAAPGPGVTAEPSSGATTGPAPSASPSPSPTAPAGPAPVVSEGAAVDPEGDGDENDDEVPDALDDDPGTTWSSSTYTTEDFGNLKSGVGYAVQLVQPALVRGVTLTTEGDGGTVELRTAEGPELDGSEVVATAELDGGEVDLTLEEPVQTQDLLLWFTTLPEVDDGYAVELSQVQVR